MWPQLKQHRAALGWQCPVSTGRGVGFTSGSSGSFLETGFWLLGLIRRGVAPRFMGKHSDIEEELGRVNR